MEGEPEKFDYEKYVREDYERVRAEYVRRVMTSPEYAWCRKYADIYRRSTSIDDAEHLALSSRMNAHTQLLLAEQTTLADIRLSVDNARAAYKYDSCYGCGAPPRSGWLCDYCGRKH